MSPVTVSEYRRGRRPANAGKRYPAEPLEPEEIAALLDALPKGCTGVRDAALIVLLWRAGLRIEEALVLAPKDLVLSSGELRVLHGKGDRWRVVAVDPGATAYVERWLALRARLGVDAAAPVFCTTRNDGGGVGRPMRSSAVRQMLKRYARKAGIAKRVHPHGLRHTHAYELMMEGQPVPLIQQQLGHIDLSMTQRYVSHLAPAVRLQALRAREWPAQLLPPAPARPVSVVSQGEPVSPVPRSVTPADSEPPAPVAAPTRDGASSARALQRFLDVLAAAGGRLTQAQLTRELGVTKARTSHLAAKLEREGLIVSSGYHRAAGQRGPGSRVWRLAPPRAKLTLDTELRDPRDRVGGAIARRGYGQQRVLDVITGLDGRASQARVARELGIGATTVAHHCRALERQGKLERGGLDKSGSNRGSQVWRVASPRPVVSASGWGRMTIVLGSSSTRRV